MLKIRRLENKSGHFIRHPEGDRDAGPERGAHQNDAIAIIASRVRFAIGGFTVLQQAALRWRTVRASIAARVI